MNQEYLTNPALSSHDLMLMKTSIRNYLYRKSVVEEPTKAQLFGSAFHEYILQPELFEQHYFCLDKEYDKRTKEYKELVSSQDISARQILDFKDFATFEAMRRNLHDYLVYDVPESWDELTRGNVDIEKPLFFEFQGHECKMMPDIINFSRGYIIDLKTIDRIESENQLLKHIWNMNYYIQAAHYVNGLDLLRGTIAEFYFVFCEKNPPYEVAFVKVSEALIEYGYRETIDLIDKYKNYLKTREVQAFNQIITADVPNWVKI